MAEGGLKRNRELLARASGLVLGDGDAGGIKIVPSATRPVKFCLGFLLRVRQVLNFKGSEGERASQERRFLSLILSLPRTGKLRVCLSSWQRCPRGLGDQH